MKNTNVIYLAKGLFLNFRSERKEKTKMKQQPILREYFQVCCVSKTSLRPICPVLKYVWIYVKQKFSMYLEQRL